MTRDINLFSKMYQLYILFTFEDFTFFARAFDKLHIYDAKSLKFFRRVFTVNYLLNPEKHW